MSVTFLIGWVTSLLSNALRARATPKKQILLEEFARFGLVGFVGFCVDTGIVYSLRYSLGLYCAGLASYVAAATVTWLLNRRWTFKGRESGQLHRQWALFMLVNFGGFLLNRGAYALLVTYVPLCAREPVFAIIPGMLLGMSSNFKLSRNIVFRPTDT